MKIAFACIASAIVCGISKLLLNQNPNLVEYVILSYVILNSWNYEVEGR